MKKPILHLLLACCLLFFGIKSASAAVTVRIASYQTPGMNGLNANPVTSGSTNIPIYGFNLTGTGTGSRTITALTFYNSGTSPGYNNVFFTTAYLYVSTTNTYVPGTTNVAANLISTYTANNSYTLTFNLSTAITVTSTSNLYYFVVLSNTLNTTAVDFECDYSGNTGGGTFTNGGAATGYDYTFAAPAAVTATAASLTTTAGNNGTSSPATISAAGTYTIFGMSVTPSATGTSKTITGLSFTTSSTNGNSYFYGTAYLFAGTATGPSGAAIATINPTTASQTLSFTGFTSTLNSGVANTLYYYVEIVYSTGVAATTSTTLSYSGYTSGATITAGATAGPAYTYNPLPVVSATAASLTTTAGSNGLSSPATISNPGNYAIYGMSLTPSATGISKALTGLSFTVASTQNNNYFYGTAYLYASASSTFSTGTATQISSVATGANTTLTFTGFTTPQNITAGGAPVYYYVYITYAIPGVAATASQTISYASATTAATVTPAAGVAGPTYTFNPIPYVTATVASLTTTDGTDGLATSPIGLVGNYAIYGMSVTPSATGISTTLTGLTFTATSTQNNNYFYATAYLYSSANSSYDGTAVKISTVTTGASKTLAFTGFTTTQTLTAGGAPIYYYIVIVYANPGAAASNTSTLAYTSATSAAVITASSTTGPTYTFNPTPALTATDIPAADLTNSTIYIGQTNIAVAGIGLTMNIGTTTLSQLTFSFTPTSTVTAGNYFTNVRVVSSTSALTSPFNYASTSPVSGATVAITTGVVTATIPAATVSTTTTYYYLVVDYTVTPEAAARTFTFNPTSYTTVLTGKVSPTYTANTFNCNQPTYYWTGAAGDNNWTTPNNWEVTTTAPILVNGYYPGQLVITDNVVISPVQTTPTINLTATKTVANLTNSPGIATALNINGAAIKLNISNQLNLGSTTSGAAASSLTLGGSGILDINNDAEINYSSTLILPANGNITIDNGSTVNLNGGTGQVAKITLSGGTIQSNGGDFEFNNSGAILTATSGTWNAVTNTTINLNGANNQIINSGATINVFDTNNFTFNSGSDNVTNNSGTFNITNSTVDAYNGTITVNGGTMNVNNDAGGGSDIELGDNIFFGLFGTTGTMTVNGGTVAVSGASLMHMAWNGSTLTNAGGLISVSTGSEIFADYAAFNNNSGTTNINASTVQLAVGAASLSNGGTMNFQASSLLEFTYTGSTATNTGTFTTANTTVNFNSTTCTLSNTAGSFNFGTSSIMNLAANNDKLTNSGTGIFTCSPLSVINLSGGSNAGNAPVISNTSSNPFTLLSDSTGSATIGKITAIATNGSLQGSFNVQRYISTASRNYRLLASQVNKTQALPGTTAAPNVVDVSALGRTVTSPATYPGAYIAGPGAGFPNIIANPLLYLYQESLLPGSSENSTFTSGKNVGIINITNASPWTVSTQSTAAGGQTASDNSTTVKIPAGNGYLLYYIHDNTSTSVSSALNSCSTTATGFINQGQIPWVMWGTTPYTSSLTLTTGTGALYPGVTMVGNPYPSSIDLNQLYTDNVATNEIFTSGTGEAFYELDPTTEQFVSYNYNGTVGLTSGSDASRYIASGQGFYVTVIKNGKQLYFNEDQKIPSTTVASVTNVPGTILEGFHVGGSGNTTDNVSLNNKTANALLLPRTLNTIYSVATNNTTSATNQAAKVSQKTPMALASLLGAGATDTTKKKVKKYDTIPPHDTTTTPPPPVAPKIAGMHLKLVMDSLTYDECGLYFNTGWSDKSDNNDAKDLDGTGGKVYLSSYSSDDLRTSINAMSDYAVAGGKRVKLFVKFSASGLYKLQLADIANFKSANYSVFLIDNMLKDSLDLTLYKSYNFNYVAGTANDSTRFVLAIEHKPVPHYALLSFSGAKSTDGVLLDWKTVNDGASITYVLQKLAANNTYVFLDSLQSDSSGAYSYIDEHPSLGTNTYRLQQTDVFGDITYSAPVTIGYNSTAPNGGLNIYPNPAKSMITVTLTTSSTVAQVATADIYNTSGTLVAHRSVNSNSFTHDVSSYQLGVYIIELKNSNGLLIGRSKFVKVN